MLCEAFPETRLFRSVMDAALLSHITPLARDYLASFEASPIRDFFAVAPAAPQEQMRALIDARLAHERTLPKDHRATVVSEIQTLADSIGASSARIKEN